MTVSVCFVILTPISVAYVIAVSQHFSQVHIGMFSWASRAMQMLEFAIFDGGQKFGIQ